MTNPEQKALIASPQRRKFLKLGVLTGATSAFALAADKVMAAGKPSREADVEILNGAIMLEQKAINTYVAAAENNLLPTKAFLDVAVQFAGDHTEHRDRLKDIVSGVFKVEPMSTENLGTFPIPANVLNGSEADVLRYALTLEMLASKSYFDFITKGLTSEGAKNVVASILPIENQHVAVYRSVLLVLLNEPALPGDDKLVPYPFLNQQPTPPVPEA